MRPCQRGSEFGVRHVEEGRGGMEEGMKEAEQRERDGGVVGVGGVNENQTACFLS